MYIFFDSSVYTSYMNPGSSLCLINGHIYILSKSRGISLFEINHIFT